MSAKCKVVLNSAFVSRLQWCSCGTSICGERECALVTSCTGDEPGAFVHGRKLVMADDVASFDAIILFHALMRDVAEEDDAVAGFGIDDDVFLGFAPFLE